MIHKRKNLIWIAPLAILGMALFVFIGGEIVLLLWNSLLPPLFGIREITSEPKAYAPRRTGRGGVGDHSSNCAGGISSHS